MPADMANPAAVSHRVVLGAASAAPAVGLVPAAHPDPLVARCAEWLAIDRESDRLSLRWAALEARLIAEHRWFELSAVEQRRLPQAAELLEIEARLDRMSDEREARLEALAGLDARDLQGVAGKLAVADRLLRHEGGPVHRLVADAARVLAVHNGEVGGVTGSGR